MNWKIKKIYISILIIAGLILSNFSILMAQDESAVLRPEIYTESMEIRTSGKLGLRIIASINEKYIEQLENQNKDYEYGIIAVPATVYEANQSNNDLEFGKTFKYSGKNYNVLAIPALRDWSVESNRITFTGVLTGISGAGFNTRYAVRAYLKVDGHYIYGDILSQSGYQVAKDMASSLDIAPAQRQFVKTNVMDACDKARGSYNAADYSITNTNSTITNGSNGKIRNYKKVIIGSSVSQDVNLRDIKIDELVIDSNGSYTINVDATLLGKVNIINNKMRTDNNITLNLVNQTGVEIINTLDNINIIGDSKIGELNINSDVRVTLASPVNKVIVNGMNAQIKVDSVIDNLVFANTAINNVITGEGSFVKVENGDKNQVNIDEYVSNSIKSVNVRGMYKMEVVLEKPTAKALTKEDMSILCRGGKDMTVLAVKTTDNQTYELSTSVFAKDDYYTFSIELEDGKIISKVFSYRVNCPTVTNAVVTRTEENRAELDLYDVDETGKIYIYIPGVTQIMTRSNEITTDIVKKGMSQQLKTGFNKVMLKGLESRITYDLYYVLEATDGRTSDVHKLRINGTIQEEINLSKKYKIEAVSEMPKNTITITLNQAPTEKLTLENFSFICPSDSELTLTGAELKVSEDRKVYKIIIPENYGHKDNQYIAKITFSDGTIAKKSFQVEFNPPKITNFKVIRNGEKTFTLTFNSDKAGVIYYNTYNWNGEYNNESNTPKVSDIISGKVPTIKKSMYAGNNEIEISFNGSDKSVFVLFMDNLGNYADYLEYTNLPKYEPQKPSGPIEIESVKATLTGDSMYPTNIKIKFSENVDILDYRPSTGYGDAKFTMIKNGGNLPSRLFISSYFLADNMTWDLDIGTAFTKGGTYKVSVTVCKDNKYYVIEKEFVVE